MLGTAKRIDEQLAPTSSHWTRAFAIDDKRAIIMGSLVDEAIALATDDAGATWHAMKIAADAWSSWAVGMDGAIAVTAGSRDGAPIGMATVAATKFAFAAFDHAELTTPTPAFPTVNGPVAGFVTTASALPALLGADAAGLVGAQDAKNAFLFYGGIPGAEAAPPLKLPANEKFAPIPYGRPARLLSLKGKDLFQRPFPAPGKPLDKPTKINFATTPTTLAELSTPPACEAGGWSFQRVKQAKGSSVIGVSAAKTVVVPLPESTTATSLLGCTASRIVVETVAPKTGAPATWASQPDIPSLASCDLAGKCVLPKNAPFRLWNETHKREIHFASTDQGVLAVLIATAGDRWGLYLAQGPGDGSLFERQRVIGEGDSSRGRIELGAFLSLGKRALLLLSADVIGTSRRGWFVLVSDDGGTTWGPP